MEVLEHLHCFALAVDLGTPRLRSAFFGRAPHADVEQEPETCLSYPLGQSWAPESNGAAHTYACLDQREDRAREGWILEKSAMQFSDV